MEKNWLPQTIKLGPFEYKIRWYERDEEDRDVRYGYTDDNEQEIGVSKRLPPAMMADTFIHEALHALWHVLGLKPVVKEEKCVAMLARGLTMIARDNPRLFEWWFSLTDGEISPKSY